LSPVRGTVDLASCYSHEEAPVLYWTSLHSPTRRVENDEEYIDSLILFDRDNSLLRNAMVILVVVKRSRFIGKYAS
jgi:hypothetical protein